MRGGRLDNDQLAKEIVAESKTPLVDVRSKRIVPGTTLVNPMGWRLKVLNIYDYTIRVQRVSGVADIILRLSIASAKWQIVD